MASRKSRFAAEYDAIAGAYAWWHMRPDDGLPAMEYSDGRELSACGDIYTFIAHHLTGAQWGLFLDGFNGIVPENDIIHKPEHIKAYPSYLYSYQAGQLARFIVSETEPDRECGLAW